MTNVHCVLYKCIVYGYMACDIAICILYAFCEIVHTLENTLSSLFIV